MRDFNRDRRQGGGRDFKRRDFDRPQEMHRATCSNCGKDCEVPFKPNGSKPVFCRECFQNNRSGDPMRPDNFTRRPSFEDRNANQAPRPTQQPNYKEQFESLNVKLDKILNLLSPKEKVEKVEKVKVVAPVEVSPEAEDVAPIVTIIKKKRAPKVPPLA